MNEILHLLKIFLCTGIVTLAIVCLRLIATMRIWSIVSHAFNCITRQYRRQLSFEDSIDLEDRIENKVKFLLSEEKKKAKRKLKRVNKQ